MVASGATSITLAWYALKLATVLAYFTPEALLKLGRNVFHASVSLSLNAIVVLDICVNDVRLYDRRLAMVKITIIIFVVKSPTKSKKCGRFYHVLRRERNTNN